MGDNLKNVHALTRIYDLLLWIIPVLEKFPRSQKFLLADRIETELLDTMALLVRAVYTRQKADLLAQANLKLEQVRFLIRLSRDLKCLGIKQYRFASEKVDETGREIGGWLKFCRAGRTS